MRKSCPQCNVTCPEYCLSLLLWFLCPPATALFLRVWSLASRCSSVSSDLLRQSCSLRTCRLVSRCSRVTLAFQRLRCSLARFPFRLHYYALHCSRPRVAWRGSVGTCNVSVSRDWDGHGQSVGRSKHVFP